MTLEGAVCGHQPDNSMSDLLYKMYPLKSLQMDDNEICRRPVWNDTGRCILHAEVESKPPGKVHDALNDGGRLDEIYLKNSQIESIKITQEPIVNANFRGAILKDVSFQDCQFWEADFSNAGLKQVSFRDSDIRFSHFHGAVCRDTSFRKAGLPDTRFDGGFLRAADFKRANVEECTFDNTDLRDADFSGAALYHASFQNVRIDDDTDFGRKTWYEGGGLAEHMMRDQQDPDEDPYQRAAWQYRMLSKLYRDNSEPEKAREYYIREKNARRVLYRRKRMFGSYSKAVLSRWITRYGESPWFVVAWSFGVIASSATLFSQVGGIQQNGEVITSDPVQLLYFSIVTFTTLGYGDFQPATELSKLVASTEAMLGSLLMALLVFVLGRRVTW